MMDRRKYRRKHRKEARTMSSRGGRNHSPENGVEILANIFHTSSKKVRMYESNEENPKSSKRYILSIASFLKRGGKVDLLLSPNFIDKSGSGGLSTKLPYVARNLYEFSKSPQNNDNLVRVRIASEHFQSKLKEVNPRVEDFTLGEGAVRLETDRKRNLAYYNYGYPTEKYKPLKHIFDSEMDEATSL